MPHSTADHLRRLLAVAEDRLADYLDRSERRETRAITLQSPETIADELDLERWTREGGMDEAAFGSFLEAYLARTTALHHPRTIGHQVAKPLMPSAVADLVNGVTNNGMAVREMGPPAVALEKHVLRWMCRHLGFPDGGGGVLVHGGSLANLTALLAARARVAPEAWERGVPDDLVLLAPETTHYSVARAAGILGLGTAAVRPLACRADGSVDVERLGDVSAELEREGRRVLAVSANACCTATGVFDDLRAIGEWCRAHGYWFHVDGAHGASALLSETHRHRMDGVELADSVTWDAHKMLHTSSLCAAVLVRDDRTLPAAFAQQASYLGDPDSGRDLDPFQRAVECTKAPLGLKLFLNLAIEGEAALAARLDHLFARTAEFAEWLAGQPDVEVAVEPQANIVCFRVGGPSLRQAPLRLRLIDTGEFYISGTEFAGRDWLRMTVMNPLTERTDVEALLERLRELAANGSDGTR